MILSGLFAGTPFYFIGTSIFVMGKLRRDLLSDVVPIASIFLIIGMILSLAQALRVPPSRSIISTMHQGSCSRLVGPTPPESISNRHYKLGMSLGLSHQSQPSTSLSFLPPHLP